MDPISDYLSILKSEFDQGSDRSCAIVVAAILEERLKKLLSARFLPNASKHDPLFDGPNAPLGSFSAKIDMAFRIGLISHKFTRDLHLIRIIRNAFAHNFSPLSFDSADIQSRVMELDRSHQIFERSAKARRMTHTRLPGRIDSGTKGHFLLAAAWMISHLTDLFEAHMKPIEPAGLEEGYTSRILLG